MRILMFLSTYLLAIYNFVYGLKHGMNWLIWLGTALSIVSLVANIIAEVLEWEEHHQK